MPMSAPTWNVKRGTCNTIVLVTHEVDIARHAHRAIQLMDGKIERDEMTRTTG